MAEVFTPRDFYTDERVTFHLSQIKVLSGDINLRKRGRKAVVEIKGQKYDVIGASCGLTNCMCDARIKLIV